ncbi:hypothetical protein B0H67DRAFT_492783 [Lasiosphaeris hirsuta]|uniref:LRR-containing protein second PH domain-containing protein n=1 Tax=Lasiosphaeris hirsuta TaxID=260670 RepID=A0AA40A864_9PEZI|nr:hypothetical protein B0H67DRAFT_492783 [Lasiosphaeris hirsuta]
MEQEHPKRSHITPLKTAEASVCDVAASPTSTIPSSPASSDGDRRFSLYSIKDKARRSLSNRGPETTKSKSQSSHVRKLSKSRPASVAAFGGVASRASDLSDSHGRTTSVTDVASLGGLSTSTDWLSQKVEAVAALESDVQFMRTRTPYLVVTADYLIKLKSRSDVMALFPCLSEAAALEAVTSSPEPLLMIPLSAIVSAIVAESTRPSFGIEVWWKDSSGLTFHQATFYFNLPTERDKQMRNIVRAMRHTQHDEYDAATPSLEVLKLLDTIHEAEEPGFKHRKLEVFPVVPRASMRKEYFKKPEDISKKAYEAPAFYLVVGTYLCHLVMIQKGKSSEPTCQHKTFGLVTLESFRGDWAIHEERFNISFRYPFEPRVTLELASRDYRQIIRVFGMADCFLKPVWPQMWQMAEIFHVKGLKEPHYLVPREDFGSVRRTLDAYVAAYRCDPVVWEINWKTKFPPEFRVLPAKDGSRYSPLQLLAVMRALRYNDYFNSLSFRDVDLGVLRGVYDAHSATGGNVAYPSRTGVNLDVDEVQLLKQSAVLHQELHALAFCSETIQQIDFSNSSASLTLRRNDNKEPALSLEFLTPILNLLKPDITKCSHLVLAGNTLLQHDLEDIVEALDMAKIHALDVSSCGLGEKSLRTLIAPLLGRPQPLQSLNLSENPGRLPAGLLLDIIPHLANLRYLNLRGSLQGERDIVGTLFPYDVLSHLENLEELDLSGFKINSATLRDLGQFFHQTSQEIRGTKPSGFRKLVLNHCGITGDAASRLCRAIGEDSKMHLSISGNPLEDGVEDLADVIRENKVPAGLSMELVEFRDESNFLLLIRALACTRSVSFLNLAGTAPTPSLHAINEPCSNEMVKELHDLFAYNQSIRYMDLSGFSGKLEDGQLAKGFARSLAGLCHNKTMTHLKLRNQNLHDDAGTLGRVLSENRSLRVVDCQDNQLNLTSLKFLVSSLKDNYKIIDFPFSPADRETIWKNILRGLRKSTDGTTTASGSGGTVGRLKHKEGILLHGIFDRQFEELDGYLLRNRTALEQASGQSLDFDLSADSLEDMEETWLALEPDEYDSRNASPAVQEAAHTAVARAAPRPRRATVRSSCVFANTAIPISYYTRQADEGMESPTETLDPVSEISTPQEAGIPIVIPIAPGGEGDFKQMIHEFTESGFESS